MMALDTRLFYPTVLQVVPTDNYKVYAYFNDGSVHLYDAAPLLEPDTVFEPLRNIRVFKDTITVIGGTVAWDLLGDRDPSKCIDIDPFTVYNCPLVSDPLDTAV